MDARLHVAPGHPEESDPRLSAFARILTGMGAFVRIDGRGANLTRIDRDSGVPRAIVEVQGLANLVHELVHVLRFGDLADDHGIDHSRIPFDLDTESGRSVLFDELAACVVSCAYVDAPHAWFAEQVEIQPVFYGHERTPGLFWAALDALMVTHGKKLHAVVEQTRDDVRSRAVALGLPDAYARGVAHDVHELWRAYRGGVVAGRPSS